MADFEAVKSHFNDNNLSCYVFLPKSQKPLKAILRHLLPIPLLSIFLKDW
jgi:hypothetical protein